MSDELVGPLEEPLHIGGIGVAAVVLAPRQLAVEQAVIDGGGILAVWASPSRITLDIYQQAVSEEKRFAQGLAFKGLMGTSIFSTLQHPKTDEKEESMSVGC